MAVGAMMLAAAEGREPTALRLLGDPGAGQRGVALASPRPRE
jgi:hypothetical protein